MALRRGLVRRGVWLLELFRCSEVLLSAESGSTISMPSSSGSGSLFSWPREVLLRFRGGPPVRFDTLRRGDDDELKSVWKN